MAAQRPKKAPPYHSLALDDDAWKSLGRVRTKLADELGFMPTASQTIRLLVKRSKT